MNPSPFHAGAGPVRGGPYRTTTALGAPVVPEVYMMSMISVDRSDLGPRSSSEPSGCERSAQARVPPSPSVVAATRTGDGPAGAFRGRTPPTPGLARTTVGSAWARMAPSSGPASLVLTGTATAPARWTAA